MNYVDVFYRSNDDDGGDDGKGGLRLYARDYPGPIAMRRRYCACRA